MRRLINMCNKSDAYHQRTIRLLFETECTRCSKFDPFQITFDNKASSKVLKVL